MFSPETQVDELINDVRPPLEKLRWTSTPWSVARESSGGR